MVQSKEEIKATREKYARSDKGKAKTKEYQIKNKGKAKNEKFLSSSIGTDGLQQDRCVTKVKVPYFFEVMIRDKTVTETATLTASTVKEPFPEEWDIVEKKPATIQFTNKCPKCGNTGTPRLDKKGMGHYHEPWYPTKEDSEQYRLIYFHKQADQIYKPCIIAKFDKKYGIFTKTGKISRVVEDYTFPNYILKNN